MNSKLIIINMAFVLLFINGCTKRFDGINQNPNSPQTVLNEQLLLPAIIKNAVRNYSYVSQFRAAVVGDYYANQYTSGFDDDWTASQTESGFLWNFFDQQKDVENLRLLSKQKGDQNNEGVALILRSWMYQVMTDNYGDMPCSKAVQGKSAGNFFPAYDKQEDIYYALMDSLKVANKLLSTGRDPVNGDILMNGNTLLWREFANGLRIRLLMRMSGVANSKVNMSTEINTIVNDPVTYPLFKSNADQAALQFTTEMGNEFPAYHNSPIGDYHLSTTLQANLLKLNDPRIAFYAMPTQASFGSGSPKFGGVPNCYGTGETNYNGGTTNQSQESPILMPVSGYPLYASKTAAQGIMLSYAEVQFNLAEARERGMLTIGSAAAVYYMNGINDQFAYDGSRLDVLSQSNVSGNNNFARSVDIMPSPNYFTQPAVAYSGSTTEKLYKIRLQKWFALFYTGFEGWSEWRRTGVPKETQIGPSSAISAWPRRTRYPLSEQTVNAANYNAALKIQGTDDLLTRVWWNK